MTQNLTSSTSLLRQEYEQAADLLRRQLPLTQRFIEAQARQLAEAMVQHTPQVHFSLPDQVVSSEDEGHPQTVPAGYRDQAIGGAGLLDRLARTDTRKAIAQRLQELELSSNRAVSITAKLLRHATAIYLVQGLLPAGRSITYRAEEGEEIPTIPTTTPAARGSAIMASTDAIAEESESEEGRGELLVPHAEAARQFYLPQWVAFDADDKLLLNSVQEAEAHVASMQHFMEVLHLARAFAPYLVADEQYQQKRYGMLGQLINQGRALARYEVREIIRTIQARAAQHDLNRGLSLSVPYFDDQALSMELTDLEVIPAGRIMFVPAFVVKAAHDEQAKVAEDMRLSPSTRRHLLQELKMLEQAFDDGASQQYQRWWHSVQQLLADQGRRYNPVRDDRQWLETGFRP
jgi:hypothetical protein